MIDLACRVRSKFAREVKTYFWEVALGHLQHVVGVGQEYIAAFTVNSHKLVFAFLESCEGFGVVAFDPACLVERNRFPAALGAIFVEQTILYDLKLELTYGAYDLSAVELVYKELGYTFVHQLLNAFFKLF